MAKQRALQVRFPEEKYAILKEQAEAIGITPSGYVRMAALQKLGGQRTHRIVEVKE